MEDMNRSPRPPLSEEEKDKRFSERLADRLQQAKMDHRLALREVDTPELQEKRALLAQKKAALEQKLAIAIARLERHIKKD